MMCLFLAFRFALQMAHKGWTAFALMVNARLYPQ